MAYKQRDAMRPTRLADFTGQSEISTQLNFLLGSSHKRDALPDHMLFSGPPGLGKTTLADIVANELELPLIAASGPALETPADMLLLLQGRKVPGVLFIDEIHRMGKTAAETLYPAMEDGTIPIRIGDGPGAEHITVDVIPFVLVGATTQAGMLPGPLRDRFGYVGRLQPYDLDALTTIVQTNAAKLGLDMDPAAAEVVASRSRGTPRVANGLLKRVRDVAEVSGLEHISHDAAVEALQHFGVDALGIDEEGRRILEALCVKFSGGPVGLSSLASAVGESASTIETVYEPHLLETGLLTRGPRGRVATDLAYEHLGIAKG